ncbi:syndetin-like [Watersipora subatra]|uniref:syndetin-like n=1 Tax=Watersipora subatra TaxID=2589382 RepID=UPI00355B5603
MDIKKRLQSLVKSKGSLPGGLEGHQDLTQLSLSDETAISKFKEHVAESHHDPRIDQENIDSIEENYFTFDSSFDPNAYELKHIKDGVTLSDIAARRDKLCKQLKSVSKRVSELILENHPAYATELKRVMELQQCLCTALTICTNSRLSLKHSQQEFTVASLRMLANHRKRQQLQGIMRSLKTIKTLQRTDVRLREMLQKEDYAGAIELCLECQKAASIFRHYTCISELNSKLQDTLESVEELLDTALLKSCNHFDLSHYTKVQLAYSLLGKTQTAMDQLHMHYASTIHNVAFTVVLGYVELCSGTGDSTFQKKQYAELCKDLENMHITHESFIPCFLGLCKALWGVLLNYHKTREWHASQEGSTPTSTSDDILDIASGEDFDRKYVAQKLEHGRGRLWQEIQLKIKTFLLAIDLSNFKFNEFTQVLNLVNRLVSIGEDFSGSKSELLQEAMHTQTQNYFHRYHSGCMEEVKMFLENEGWELCPVKPSFTILQLQEFSFMRNTGHSSGLTIRTKLFAGSDATLSSTSSASELCQSSNHFSRDVSPFDEQPDEEVQEDLFTTNGNEDSSDSDADIASELKADYIDEEVDSPSSRPKRKSMLREKSMDKDRRVNAPVLTNSSLTVLRQFGKYMKMMTLLEPIAFQVINSMSQLFDFYFYTVYKRFAVIKMGEDPTDAKSGISSKLQATLQRLNDDFQCNGTSGYQEFGGSGTAETLYNLSEKVVATESLVYLAKQFEFLEPYLEKAIPASKKAFLQQFYSQTIVTIPELRYPVYQAVTDKVLNQEHIVSLIGGVRWDIKDIMSQHNNYVDIILRELQQFAMRLAEIEYSVPVSAEVKAVLWQQCAKLASQTFVEGLSSVKKCSPEGRALMQLDFQQFLMKFERISGTRPAAAREYVETYIKAYYLPEDKLELWAKEHKEYTGKQIMMLVNCVPQLNRKGKQKIFSQLEEQDSSLIRNMSSSPLVHIQNFTKKHRRDNST